MKSVSNSEEFAQNAQAELTTLRMRVTELEALVKLYEAQLLQSKRKQFGSSSEKTDSDLCQISLFGGAEIAAPPEVETEEISYRRKKRKGKREEDLSGLPVTRVDYELPEEERRCPRCGETMRDIGVDVRDGVPCFV